jgi:aconitate hydratase
VVTDYLGKAGLLAAGSPGLRVVAYGCTTCIGNAGLLAPELEGVVTGHDLICASVLSGNRNFEARIHPAIKANFLMSPPLVVAFALAGRVGIDLTPSPGHRQRRGRCTCATSGPARKKSAPPSPAPPARNLPPPVRRLRHRQPLWNAIATSTGHSYGWDTSTYIAEPPFFDDFRDDPAPIPSSAAPGRWRFGDSVTTDHISPAGSIKASSRRALAAGPRRHPDDFNSYGSRRGNHEVMMRGTFANVRIRNLMLPPDQDGGRWKAADPAQPGGALKTIFDAAMDYQAAGTPTVIFAGDEYGTGSSRDWAAKGTRLLGVKAVVAKSFERIHRSNLVGMGVLPCSCRRQRRNQPGHPRRRGFDLSGLEAGIAPARA